MYDALIGFSVNKEETIVEPEPPKNSSSKITISSLPRTVAGSSLNVALGLKEFGCKVKLLLTVGRDSHADDISDKLTEWSVDHFQLRVKNNTARTIVFVPAENPKEARQFCYKPDYDLSLMNIAIEKINEQIIVCQPKNLVATGVRSSDLPLVSALFSGKGEKVLNPSIELLNNSKGFSQLLNKITLLIVNHEEAAVILNKKPEEFNGEDDIIKLRKKLAGVKEIIVTFNSKGSYWMNCNHQVPYHQPSLAQKVVDPTGAGDSYLAGFLFSRINGRSIEESMLFASAAAAAKMEKIGGSSVPQIKEVKKYL